MENDGVYLNPDSGDIIATGQISASQVNFPTVYDLRVNNEPYFNYVSSAILDPFKTISMIRPYSQNNLIVELDYSETKDFANSVSVDSSTSSAYFSAFDTVQGKWLSSTSSGFVFAYSNCPVIVDFRGILSANGFITDNSTTLYVRYRWYWQDTSKHYSDWYSLVLPTNTEVGANARDTASKRDFETLQQKVLPAQVDVDIEAEYETYYGVYSNQYSNIISSLDSESKILLYDYSQAENYRMQLSTVSSDSDISVKFYVDYGNGPEYDENLAINHNSFKANSTYVIEVKNDCIAVDSVNKQDVVKYLSENSNSVTLRVWA